ncbi:hypothetical protein BH23CHL9_BH23CHL9_14280 [soil metagenome]
MTTNQVSASAPLGFSELSVPIPSHTCLFYYDDEELRAKLGFVRIGLETDDQAVVLFGPARRLKQVLGYVAQDLGRNVSDDLATGKIVLLDDIDGESNADSLLAGIGGGLDELMARGVTLIRFLGFIGWQDPAWPDHEQLLAFESRVNQAAAQYPSVVLCTYRLTDVPGPLLIYGGIETHPLTIIGQTICENPHYVVRADQATAADAAPPWMSPDRAKFRGLRIQRQEDSGP